jgi:hypothetical protein
MMISRVPRIAHKATVIMRVTKCAGCGKPLADEPDWILFSGPSPLCASRCAPIVAPPELFSILALIDPTDSHADDRLYCVSSSEIIHNTVCPQNGSRIERRIPYELAGAGNGKHFSVTGGEVVCPALSGALERFYGTATATKTPSSSSTPS